MGSTICLRVTDGIDDDATLHDADMNFGAVFLANNNDMSMCIYMIFHYLELLLLRLLLHFLSNRLIVPLILLPLASGGGLFAGLDFLEK
jgi:hypothetical protein